ncbi:MAG TPA: sigma-70 family RNA polymerase sigma factor [Polyangiaceae bacterium]|nr:sigma-70 family RNA polymerase sigma factor [Polyangiaceae bacterium]
MSVNGLALASGLAPRADSLPALLRARAMPAADESLRRAVAEHLDLVWRVLRRAGLLPADAEDATQDVFWVLAQRLDAVPERARRAFLMATALRVASDRRRSKWHRSVDTGLDLEQKASAERGADERLELRRAAELLDRALGTLDEPDRAVYIMAELEELSRTEVAEALGIPKGTVASRLRRARDAFESAVRRLQREGRR